MKRQKMCGRLYYKANCRFKKITAGELIAQTFILLKSTQWLQIQTRRERPKSAPYLRLKNIQGTTIGKIWKKFFFKKKIFDFFFEKKYFLGRTMPKNSKRGHSGSFNVFYKPKTSKKFKGVPFDKFRKFSKKVA